MADDAAQVGEYLFWVGCAGAFDDRAVKISRAVVTLLQAAGVSFSILGTSENCCGDPMRRIGNEYLFQMLAAENVETLNDLGVKKIVTLCPHCLNTLKNEYPAFGGAFEVVHHTELLADLLAQGRLQLSNGSTPRVAYHDSCYLGRYQGEYQQAPGGAARRARASTVLEAARNKSKSLCCGAGGGRMWMEEDAGPARQRAPRRPAPRDVAGRHRRQLPVLPDDDGGRPRERRSGQGRPRPRPRRDPGRSGWSPSRTRGRPRPAPA